MILINGGGIDGQAEMKQTNITLTSIGLHAPSGSAVSVRNIWQREDATALAPGASSFKPPAVPPRSSSFWLLTPKKD